MKPVFTSVLSLGLFAAAALPLSAAPDRTPVLLELFTSEGCSSCPPADKLLQTLDKNQPVAGADLIVLSEHVDYWNHGGWSDPYSSASFSNRQREYAEQFRLDSVYTPQLVVDGSTELVGSNAAQARSAITKAAGMTKLPIALSSVSRNANNILVHLHLSSLPAGKGIIYLALADNEDRSEVGRGENAGRSLTHVAVVRALVAVGNLGSEDFSKDLSIPVHSHSALRLVVFVQDPASRKVLAVAQQKL